MKTIKCACGRDILMDDHVYEEAVKHNWRCSESGYVYTRMQTTDGREAVPFASLVFAVSDNLYHDHINGDGHNNMSDNLRPATRTQNNQNTRMRRNNQSGYRNVCWAAKVSKWQAQCRSDGKLHFLGYFDRKIDAAMAANHFMIQRHGEFARLNNVTKDPDFIGPTLP